ncbi:hypothetical protein LINPERPRIM_LOCUS27783 [Linum perenne]
MPARPLHPRQPRHQPLRPPPR